MNDKPSTDPERVQQRFGLLNLSDCRLLGIRIGHQAGAKFDEVHLELGLITGENADQWVPGRLSFLACASINVDMDVWAKFHCSDMIADATCRRDTGYAAALALEDPKKSEWQSLNALLLFEINLVQPSGKVRVFARDFVLTKLPTS